MSANFSTTQSGAPVVDDHRPRVRQHRRRSLLEHLDARAEEARAEQIVVRRPLEVLAAREVEAAVVVRPRPEVAWVPDVTHAGVPSGVGGADLRGAVGGGVVGDDQLEVPEVLLQDRVDGPREVALAVEDGQADADARCSGGHGVPGLVGCC